MLEGLDSIEWSKLSHAYGKAKDVPKLIRALGGTKPKAADDALSELFGNIWHQGTVYEATPYAVPFLVELVTNPTTHQRPQIMLLLQSIAEGTGYHSAHEPGSPLVVHESEHVAKSHEAVDRHLDDLVALRHDASLEVRQQLPALLVPVKRGKQWILSNALDQLKAEPEGHCAANWIFAISRCCVGDPAWAGRLDLPDSPAHPIIHLAIAHVKLASGEEQAAEEAARDVMQAFLAPERYEDYFQGNACFIDKNSCCGMDGVFMGLIRLLPPAALEMLIAPTCEVAPQLEEFSAEMICEPLLPVVFAGVLPQRIDDMSREQKILVQQVARTTNVSHGEPTRSLFEHLQLAGILSELGIPSRVYW